MLGPLDDGKDQPAFDKWFWRSVVVAGLTALASEAGILLAQELRRGLKKSRKGKKEKGSGADSKSDQG